MFKCLFILVCLRLLVEIDWTTGDSLIDIHTVLRSGGKVRGTVIRLGDENTGSLSIIRRLKRVGNSDKLLQNGTEKFESRSELFDRVFGFHITADDGDEFALWNDHVCCTDHADVDVTLATNLRRKRNEKTG